MEVNETQPRNLEATGPDLKNTIHRQKSLTSLILLLIFLVATGFGVAQKLSLPGLESQKNQLKLDTTKLQEDIAKMDGNSVLSAELSRKTLENVKKEEILWSEVITGLNSLVPMGKDRRPTVRFLSYSGTGEGRLNVSAVTVPAALPPFNDVAQIIAVFSNSIFFRDVYVPSISRGSNENGQSTLSFVLNMRYVQPETGDVGQIGSNK